MRTVIKPVHSNSGVVICSVYQERASRLPKQCRPSFKLNYSSRLKYAGKNLFVYKLRNRCFVCGVYSPRNDPNPEMNPNPEMIPKSTPKGSRPRNDPHFSSCRHPNDPKEFGHGD